MLVGFDVSTSTIGYTLLHDTGQFHSIGYLRLDKIKNYYKKLDKVEELFAQLKKENITKIFMEEALGRSNNQFTINLLQRWNGMVCVCIYKQFNIEPQLIPELTARKLNGIKVPKGIRGVDKKRFCLTFVKQQGTIPDSVWEYKKTGDYKMTCYDMCDSFIIAKAGYLNV